MYGGKNEKPKGARVMLKGVNKQIIEINDTGSDCFEKVLFFVKPEYLPISQNRLEISAQNYIDTLLRPGVQAGGGYLRRRQKKKKVKFCFAGACIIGAAAAIVGLICLI